MDNTSFDGANRAYEFFVLAIAQWRCTRDPSPSPPTTAYWLHGRLQMELVIIISYGWKQFIEKTSFWGEARIELTDAVALDSQITVKTGKKAPNGHFFLIFIADSISNTNKTYRTATKANGCVVVTFA